MKSKKNIKFIALVILIFFYSLLYCVDASQQINRYYDERFVIKDFNDNIDGYPYVSFSDGIMFNNKELVASRISYSHKTDISSEKKYGKIIFFERTTEGLNKKYPNINYDKYNGELRDPNLSESNIPGTFFLSCFTTGENNSHTNVLMLLNENYEVISDIEYKGGLAWGNTLISPDGYLLQLTYGSGKVTLYKSVNVFDGNLQNMEFHDIAVLNTKDYPTESTIGYYNDKLVCISRTNKNLQITYTTDLEGKTGWSIPDDLGQKIHSPTLLSSFKGDKLIFAGSLEKGNTYRVPVIGYIDLIKKEIIDLKEIDNEIKKYRRIPFSYSNS